MYETYGDWHLVLASYNCGPGNVNKAIRRAGGKTDFWEIFPYLPKETRTYVPLFIAATYVMSYHCEHNLCPIRTSLSMASDTLMNIRTLHLRQVADILNVDIELIRMLNPQYKREIIPGHIRPSVLKLPVAATHTFIDREDSIYNYHLDELLANAGPVNSLGENATDSNRETIKHTVAAGENLYTIANRYGVTAKDIRKSNRLSSNKVPKGKLLTIHINNGGIAYATKNSPDTPAKEETAAPVAPVKQTAEVKAKPADTHEDYTKTISYTVQSGDSLYSISKKYPGVTIAKIQSVNHMKDSKIRAGQILKIPVG
jgi:membrane-bound lytic murein transglycosylase D